MKKTNIAFSAMTAVALLAACGSNDNNGEEAPVNNAQVENNEPANEPDQNNEENMEQENDANDPDVGGALPQDEEAVDVLEQAISFHEGLTSVYVDSVSESMVGEEMTTTDQMEWIFVEGDITYVREESMTSTEDGADIPLNIMFTDESDPAYHIFYTEGDEEAIRYEAAENTAAEDIAWFNSYGERYDSYMVDAGLTYVGEEEVNGFNTHHIDIELEGQTLSLWFDQETYMEVRSEGNLVLTGEGDAGAGSATTTREVLEFEVNPEFDESLFMAPEGMEVTEGSYEDIASRLNPDGEE
ncbi:hypothetical protein FLK61_40810 [Paenalkalicoccus suaedae]|uniref:LppX_LprAFG lipoprotein n=1 Tax=Paenalkalicoccus suaedae TaxID=2592382 RepID=A0A859FJG2_9BACI|nr:hypothetical protein [Paenalkalicoccus suaedae]QKS72943.1 hypothetical protein FLK61_40810 [Paenalkalicoccus suaedae]